MYDDLIARLEAATGPDRELDLRVKAAAYGGVVFRSPFNGEWCLYREGTTDPRTGRAFERPRHVAHSTWINDHFTASIDAALTLVPKGWGWVDLEIAPKATTASLNNCKRMVEERASTPALAIVIAALRAKSDEAMRAAEVALMQPCPFCGSDEIGHTEKNTSLTIVCMKCGARGPEGAVGDTEQEEVWDWAYRLWNQRAPEGIGHE